MARLTWCLGALLLLLALAADTEPAADDTKAPADEPQLPQEDPPIDWDNLSQYRVKQLKEFLQNRGVECPKCTEKWDLIEKLQESKDLPLRPVEKKKAKPKKAKAEKKPESFNDFNKDDIMDFIRKKAKEEDDMKEKLRKAGIDPTGMNFGNSGGQWSEFLKNFGKGKGKGAGDDEL
eukprot:TRINITY_DN74615_c0_g1_i1.p1 TRINITY_DN74615_c0_g1~~TRINITY_DN74615_c0_g1_i1.p1  ORF type:complete len:177 (+),score=48.35 TRINITY_DN74615_c0_g1_i1:60-590(+)